MIKNPFSIFDLRTIEVTMFTKEDDLSNDQDACNAVGCNTYASLRQVHGSTTIIVREPTNGTDQADGMITDQKDLLMIIRIADCQPFVIAVPEKQVAGVLHVGWKSLHDGAITSFYKTLKQEWNIDPSETYVGIGPSLCTQCADFTDPKIELPHLDSQFFSHNHVDLRGAADAELLQLGVQKNKIERHSHCTRCHPELYWTYRGGDKEEMQKGKRNMLACRLI